MGGKGDGDGSWLGQLIVAPMIEERWANSEQGNSASTPLLGPLILTFGFQMMIDVTGGYQDAVATRTPSSSNINPVIIWSVFRITDFRVPDVILESGPLFRRRAKAGCHGE